MDKGVSEMVEVDNENIKRVLNPKRFPGMSGKMAAIVGYFLGINYTDPYFAEMVITSDGFVMARLDNDCGCNEFLGDISDIERNWNNLIHIPELGLSENDIEYLEGLPNVMIRG